MFSVTINPRHLAAAQALFDSKQMNQAMRSAATSGMKRGRTLIRREVQEEIKVKAGAFNDAVKAIPKPAGGNTYGGTLRVSHKPIPLYKYANVRKTKRKGVIANVWKKRPAQVMPWAFEATMRSGAGGFWTRRGQGERKIRRVWGPSIIGEVEKRAVSDRIAQAIQQTMEARFLSQYKRFGIQAPPDVPGLSGAEG